MFNYWINSLKIAIALFGIFSLVLSASPLDQKSLTCGKSQKNVITSKQKSDILSWNITLELNGQPTMLKRYKFSIRSKQNIKRLQWEVSPNQQNKEGQMKYLMIFLTKSEIQITQNTFNVNEFLENRLNGQAIASSLNGLYSHQDFAKLYYEEQEEVSNKEGEGKIQTYYVYIYYFLNKFKYPHIGFFDKKDESVNDYTLSLILNPKVKDICEGYSNKQNICKCDNNDKITQYCNVDVVYLSRLNSNMNINPQKFRQSQVFLYLNHTEFYKGFSEEKKFKLNIKQLSDNTDHEMVVYEKFIEKQDFNDILPMKEFFLEERMNKKIIESPKNFEFTIQKEIKDRIFYVYVNDDTFEIEVSLTIINEENDEKSGNSNKNEAHGKINGKGGENEKDQTIHQEIQPACTELQVNQANREIMQFNYTIFLKKLDQLECFTFELAPNQNKNEFLLKLSGSPGVDLEDYQRYQTLIISKVMVNSFSYSDFVENKYYKDKGFTSSLDQLYSNKKFPKLYYKDKDEGNNKKSLTDKQRYFIFIFSRLSVLKSVYGQQKLESQPKFELSLLLNPKDKDLCKGSLTKDSACKCENKNFITLDCDVQVVNLHEKKGSTFIINPSNDHNEKIYLNLDHEELFSGISEDKLFKLVLKAIGSNEINKFAVFDEYVDKQEINEILPYKKYVVESYKPKFDRSLYKLEHEFIIKKKK